MKKTIAALCALGTAAVFASELLVTFSTPGPDKYADDTTVLDNECYSLVYTHADGSQEKILTVPAARDGKCAPVLFRISDSSKYNGGEWGVYLLDTRDFAADATGKTLSAFGSDGQPEVINVSAVVANGIASSGINDATATDAVAAGAYDLAAANVPQPKVTGIKIIGANVVVTVKDTVPYVGYTLQSASGLQGFSVPEGAAAANGNVSDEIILVTPKVDGAQFFKVSTVK